MGKGILIILAASVIGGSMLLYQAQRTAAEINEEQAAAQEKVLAREIARSAYNAALATARAAEQEEEMTAAEIVDLLNSSLHRSGDYQGGTYTYSAQSVAGSTYRIEAKGVYGDAYYIINGGYASQVPTVPEYCRRGCTVTAEFIESSAGYCSAVYVQLLVPTDNVDYDDGDDEEDDDYEAPHGEVVGGYRVLEPELVFTPGHNRDHVGETYERTLYPGTKVNFILAVDKNCSLEGQEVPFDPARYDHIRYAFKDAGESLDQLVETNWVIYEKHAEDDGVWRIAFEDRPDHFGDVYFTDAKLRDVKENGYPANGRDSDDQWNGTTYGGDGWSYQSDGSGYANLEDYGVVPDFSDQVFDVEFNSTGENGGIITDLLTD